MLCKLPRSRSASIQRCTPPCGSNRRNSFDRETHRAAASSSGPKSGSDSLSRAADKEIEYAYVLRVYDAKGRFDETVPLTIARTEKDLEPVVPRAAAAPGIDEDRTALRNINGGAVTVFGRNVPADHQVVALGETVPTDPNRSFVVQRILPPGDHDVDVSVRGAAKAGVLYFNRQINIPDNDWFYVAMADLTIGKRTGDAHIEDVRPGEYDKVYTKGRLAFYSQGEDPG